MLVVELCIWSISCHCLTSSVVFPEVMLGLQRGSIAPLVMALLSPEALIFAWGVSALIYPKFFSFCVIQPLPPPSLTPLTCDPSLHPFDSPSLTHSSIWSPQPHWSLTPHFIHLTPAPSLTPLTSPSFLCRSYSTPTMDIFFSVRTLPCSRSSYSKSGTSSWPWNKAKVIAKFCLYALQYIILDCCRLEPILWRALDCSDLHPRLSLQCASKKWWGWEMFFGCHQ